MKKLLFTIGTMISFGTPIAAVIACGDSTSVPKTFNTQYDVASHTLEATNMTETRREDLLVVKHQINAHPDVKVVMINGIQYNKALALSHLDALLVHAPITTPTLVYPTLKQIGAGSINFRMTNGDLRILVVSQRNYGEMSQAQLTALKKELELIVSGKYGNITQVYLSFFTEGSEPAKPITTIISEVDAALTALAVPTTDYQKIVDDVEAEFNKLTLTVPANSSVTSQGASAYLKGLPTTPTTFDDLPISLALKAQFKALVPIGVTYSFDRYQSSHSDTRIHISLVFRSGGRTSGVNIYLIGFTVATDELTPIENAIFAKDIYTTNRKYATPSEVKNAISHMKVTGNDVAGYARELGLNTEELPTTVQGAIVTYTNLDSVDDSSGQVYLAATLSMGGKSKVIKVTISGFLLLARFNRMNDEMFGASKVFRHRTINARIEIIEPTKAGMQAPIADQDTILVDLKTAYNATLTSSGGGIYGSIGSVGAKQITFIKHAWIIFASLDAKEADRFHIIMDTDQGLKMAKYISQTSISNVVEPATGTTIFPAKLMLTTALTGSDGKVYEFSVKNVGSTVKMVYEDTGSHCFSRLTW